MRLLLAALSCSAAVTARADDFADPDNFFATPMAQTQQFAINPFYGFRFGGELEETTTDTEYELEDGPAYGLCLSFAPPDYLGRFELLWSHQDTGIDFKGSPYAALGTVDVTIDVIQIGGVSEFGTERLRPYVSAHLGATHYSAEGYDSDTRFSFGIGAGVKAFLSKNLYLSADIRGFCTVTDSEGGFIYVNGIAIASFSGETMWQGQASLGLGLTF